MDTWKKMYEEARKLYNPHEVSTFVYANHVVAASQGRGKASIYRVLYGRNLWCISPLCRVHDGLRK